MYTVRFIHKIKLLAASWVLASATAGQGQSGYDYFLTGNASDNSNAGSLGGVLLAGGGTDVDSAMTWFKSRADGGDIVILRASGSDGYNDYLYSELGGMPIDSVETFVMESRSASFDSFVISSIQNAEAIFFAGGDQGDYYELWQDTPLEDAVNQRAAEGAAIGGTSAGLAILGSSAYVALERSLTSSRALSNPYHRDVTLSHDFLEIPNMEGVITDSHFSAREREGRLMTMLARSLDETDFTPFRGIGINDRTAVVIAPDGQAVVHGRTVDDSAAFAFETTRPADVLAPNQALTLQNVRAVEFEPGDIFDFSTFTAAEGIGRDFSYDVINGVLGVGPAIDPPGPLMGDMDGSGIVDLNDVLAFVQAVRDPADYVATYDLQPTHHGDVNADGRFDLRDLEPFAAMLNDPAATGILAVLIPEPSSSILICTIGAALFRRGN